MEPDIRKSILAVLEKGFLLSLGTRDDGGVWVSDVIYVHDDAMNVYWMSDPDCRHSKVLRKNKQVAGTITVSGRSPKEKSLGLQIDGIAKKIDGARFDLAKKFFAKKGKKPPKETDDVLQGDSWYMLKTKKIEYLDEERYGFEKKAVEL